MISQFEGPLKPGMLLKVPVHRGSDDEVIGWIAIEVMTAVDRIGEEIYYRVALLAKELPRPEFDCVFDIYKSTYVFNKSSRHEISREDLPLLAGARYHTERYRELLSEGF
ncbi:MAG: hypothetical protein GF334_06875 [Candidatus Altiarchaeales archaeon]|nr:hypothetical protein [Candidatus Altiarchaeales archaeon]